MIGISTYSSIGYRFAFNGMEQDNEVSGDGNSLDFGARIYDSRLGRWLAVDPLQHWYPELSDYSFVRNSPLLFIDPNGKEIDPYSEENMWGNCVYKGFSSQSHGAIFARSVEQLYYNSSSSDIFSQAYDRLRTSNRVYKFGENNPDAQPTSWGKFNFEHEGTNSDPYTINLTYWEGYVIDAEGDEVYETYSGLDKKSTIFEETFHAAQYDYYVENGIEFNNLQFEVEAKIAKVFQGITDQENKYEMNFANKPVVKAYAEALKSGSEIDFNLQYAFDEAVQVFTKEVFEQYKGSWFKAGGQRAVDFNSIETFNYDSNTQFLQSLIEANIVEPVIIKVEKEKP